MTIDCEATPNRPRQAETRMYTGSTVTSRNSLSAAAAKGISLLLRLESLTEVLFNNLNDFPARLNLGFYGFKCKKLSMNRCLKKSLVEQRSLERASENKSKDQENQTQLLQRFYFAETSKK